MIKDAVIEISNLSMAEVLSLQEEMNGITSEVKQSAVQGTSHGSLDANTVMIFALSLTAIQMLGAWLLKNRETVSLKMTVKTPTASGEVEEKVIEYKSDKSISDKELLKFLEKKVIDAESVISSD